MAFSKCTHEISEPKDSFIRCFNSITSLFSLPMLAILSMNESRAENMTVSGGVVRLNFACIK